MNETAVSNSTALTAGKKPGLIHFKSGNIHLLQNARGLWKKLALLCLALFVFELIFAIVGTSAKIKINMLKDLKEIPPFVEQMMGKDFMSAMVKYGVIAIGYMHPFMMVIFILFPFMAVSRLVTSEISSGTIGFTLSRPVSRKRLYFNLGVIIYLGLGFLAFSAYLSSFAGITFFHGGKLSVEPFSALSWNIYLIMLFISGYIVLLASVADTGKKLFTYGGVAFLLLYLLNFAAPLWSPLETLLPVNPFSYYDPFGALMGQRVSFGTSVTLIAVSAAMFTAGAWIFSRRDISGG